MAHGGIGAVLPRAEHQRDEGRHLRPAGIGALTAALAVALVPLIWPPEMSAWIWIFETGAVLLAGSGWRVLFEPGDLTESVHWMNGLMAVMFIIHPALTLSEGIVYEPYHYKFYIAPYYSQSCAISFVFAFSLNLGYALSRRYVGRLQQRAADLISGHDVAQSGEVSPRVTKHVKSFTLLGLAAACLAAVSGGSITSAFAKSDGLTSAYLYMAPLVLGPACCLLYAVGMRTGNRAFRALATVITILIAIILASVGQRTGLISGVGAFFVAVVCVKGMRIPRTVALMLIIAGMFGFALLRDFGSSGGDSDSAVVADFSKSPWQYLMGSLDGSDTEMVDAVAVEASLIPSQISYSPKQETFAVVGAAVPRALWPAKPRTMDQRLNAQVTGAQINQASIAYSFAGEGWYAGGWIGVAIFGGLTGAIYARVTNIYRRSAKGVLATCLYALATPLAIVLLRGALAYTLAYCLFYLGPVLYLMIRTNAWARKDNEASRTVSAKTA